MTTYDPTLDEVDALLDFHAGKLRADRPEAHPTTPCYGCGAARVRLWPVPLELQEKFGAEVTYCARCEPFVGEPLTDWSEAA